MLGRPTRRPSLASSPANSTTAPKPTRSTCIVSSGCPRRLGLEERLREHGADLARLLLGQLDHRCRVGRAGREDVQVADATRTHHDRNPLVRPAQVDVVTLSDARQLLDVHTLAHMTILPAKAAPARPPSGRALSPKCCRPRSA